MPEAEAADKTSRLRAVDQVSLGCGDGYEIEIPSLLLMLSKGFMNRLAQQQAT